MNFFVFGSDKEACCTVTPTSVLPLLFPPLILLFHLVTVEGWMGREMTSINLAVVLVVVREANFHHLVPTVGKTGYDTSRGFLGGKEDTK